MKCLKIVILPFLLSILLIYNNCIQAQESKRDLSFVPLSKINPEKYSTQIEQSYGVFVGVDKFEDISILPLKCASADAKAVRDCFVNELGYLPEKNTRLLITGAEGENRPTCFNVLKAIRFAAQSAGPNGCVIVHLSTHGIEGYVLAEDSQRAILQDSAIKLSKVQDYLSASRSPRRLLFFDACREKVASDGEKAIGGMMSGAFANAFANAKGFLVIMSCSEGQYSYEMTPEGQGAFTHFLLEGLRGSAPANPDGLITITTLAPWVKGKVEEWSKQKAGGIQSPLFTLQEASGDMPLAASRSHIEERKKAKNEETLRKLGQMLAEGKLTAEQFKLAQSAVESEDPKQQKVIADLIAGKIAPDYLGQLLASISKSTQEISTKKSDESQSSQKSESGGAKTLFAAQDGSSKYSTIQSAIDEAQSGDTIMVKPGVYVESIKFKKGIRVIGTDAGACRIEPVEGAAAILTAIDCPSGSIESLTFDGRGKSFKEIYGIGAELENKDGGVFIKSLTDGGPAARAGMSIGSRIISVNGKSISDLNEISYMASMNGKSQMLEIEVEGNKNYKVNSEKVNLKGSWPDGLALIDSSLEIQGCNIQNLVGSGIIIYGRKSSPFLKKNKCIMNKGEGIGVRNYVKGTIEGNICSENAKNGISIYGSGSELKLKNNECKNNNLHGIGFSLGAMGTAEGNICENNTQDGIFVQNSETAPILKNNECKNNNLNGIGFARGAGGTAENNICQNNVYSGIAVFDVGTAPNLKNNKCKENKKQGIYFGDKAGGTADGNTCENNEKDGIFVNNSGTAPILKNNKCNNNNLYGIEFGHGARGTSEGNICENNAYYGIAIFNVETAPNLNNNKCNENKKFGIYFGDKAGGTADGNTCENNANSGIAVYDVGTAPYLKNNKCNKNKFDGIYFANGARGTAEYNTCEYNEQVGIFVNNSGTAPMLKNNECNNNKMHGIDFENGAGGTAEGNTCEYNEKIGIAVFDEGTAPILKNNKCQSNRNWQVSYSNGAIGKDIP